MPIRPARLSFMSRGLLNVVVLVVAMASVAICPADGFLLHGKSYPRAPLPSSPINPPFHYGMSILLPPSSTSTDEADRRQVRGAELDRPKCFWKIPLATTRAKSFTWKPRYELLDLTIGQELADAIIVQDLLKGVTGPKLFVDCGVGRFRYPKWKIQTAMLRLGPRGMKISVATKRAARLRKRMPFPVYVSRIRPDSDQLEVCLSREEALDWNRSRPPPRPLSSLMIGQELVGTVKRVTDYGALVDVGANRPGLLHIQRVADLYGKYIHKADGIVNAGLERGARIRVQVQSNERKRLFLDFTDDVKEEAAKELLGVQRSKQKESALAESFPTPVAHVQQIQEMRHQETEQENDGFGSDDDDDDDDEDREIEDALGLGTY